MDKWRKEGGMKKFYLIGLFPCPNAWMQKVVSFLGPFLLGKKEPIDIVPLIKGVVDDTKDLFDNFDWDSKFC